MINLCQRTRRSEAPTEALHLLFEACRERGGFEMLVLFDELGEFVSGSATTETLSSGAMERFALSVVGVPFELAVQGRGAERELTQALEGAHRILAA